MSAMTEERLAEIEMNNINSLTELDLDLIAEVRRLRECIEKAPDNSALTGWPEKKRAEFKQWQREALGE